MKATVIYLVDEMSMYVKTTLKLEPQSKSLAKLMRDLLPIPREQVLVTATLQAQALTSSTSSKL